MAKNEMPNRLFTSGLTVLSTDPLVGVLALETDEGPERITINTDTASELARVLQKFLDEDEV